MSTISDVARLAGVSKTTVSHVLNETRRVNPETAQRVRDAARMLAYTPNSIARSLALRSTSSIGVAISSVSNVYFNEIVRAIEDECSAAGLTMLQADTHDDPEHEARVVRALHERRVDGVVLAPSTAAGPDSAIAFLQQRRVPTVLVDRTAPAELDQVAVENIEATRRLVDHLADHGHRRIGFVHGLDGLTTTSERLHGFRLGVAARGLDADAALLVDGRSSLPDAAVAVNRLLDLAEPPTAILTGNNKMTLGAMQALRARGVTVPADMALAGFDDFEWSDYFEPRLTVVAQPCDSLGRTALRLLRDRIAEPDRIPTVVREEPNLVIRNSCGCP